MVHFVSLIRTVPPGLVFGPDSPHTTRHHFALLASPAVRHLANAEIGQLSNAGIVHLPDARAGTACYDL